MNKTSLVKMPYLSHTIRQFSLLLILCTEWSLGQEGLLTVIPGPLVVQEGEDVDLWCKQTYDPVEVVPVNWQTPPNFKTRTSNCSSFSEDKYTITCSGQPGKFDFYNLTIHNVEWSDMGMYRCLYQNQKAFVNITVSVPVKQVTMTNDKNTTARTMHLRNGTDAELTCRTDCTSPPSRISWTRNDQAYNGTAKSSSMMCEGKQQGLIQTVSAITVKGQSTAGESLNVSITCSAENLNDVQGVSSTVYISYYVPVTEVMLTPPFNSTTGIHLLKNGTDALMSCQTNCAFPIPVITWTKNNQPFDGVLVNVTDCEHGLKQTRSTASVRGLYLGEGTENSTMVCSAENIDKEPSISSKALSLSVYVPVTEVTLTQASKRSNQTRDTIFLKNGTETVLTCQSSCAFPSPIMTWAYNDLTDSANITDEYIDCKGPEKGLMKVVSHTTVRMNVNELYSEANYTMTCAAENVDDGSQISKSIAISCHVPVTEVTLTQASKRSNQTRDTIFLKNGTETVLTCQSSCAFPSPRMTWAHNDLTYNASRSDEYIDCKGPEKGLMKAVSSITVRMNVNELYSEANYTMTCAAENVDDGSQISKSIAISYHVPITMITLYKVGDDAKTESVETLLVRRGTTIHLKCQTNCAFPMARISWTRNTRPAGFSRTDGQTDCNGEHFGLKRAFSFVKIGNEYVNEESQQSKITCSAVNLVGEAEISKSIVINYYVPVTHVIMKANIGSVSPVTLFLTRGTYAKLTCRTSCGFPTPKIGLYLNNEQILLSKNSTTTQVVTQGLHGLKCTVTSIVIESQNLPQICRNCTLTCRGWNVANEKEISNSTFVSFYLAVTKIILVDKSQSADSSLVEKGTDTLLTCRTSCSIPAPKIRWFQNGEPYNGRADFNATECKKGQPDLKQYVSTVKIEDNNEQTKKFNITCLVDSFPHATVISKSFVITYKDSEIQGSNASTGLIGGIVVGCLFVMAIIVVTVLMVQKRRQSYETGREFVSGIELNNGKEETNVD